MTEGLITRIGRWMDRKWEAAATCREVEEQEDRCSKRQVGALAAIAELAQTVGRIELAMAKSTQMSEVSDLKTRIEKIELYAGMTRKVDPTKPPVVKSAFSM